MCIGQDRCAMLDRGDGSQDRSEAVQEGDQTGGRTDRMYIRKDVQYAG